ncbi:hypothetical protein DdX_00856 [Ditylenchus destructor]|uniref:Uncharacterized protein n=1 Tax=Ditylenchus destructor TaxID=166010 RepID=A0AAD4RAS4_9BILA|nr:hypothetical protein DdX_00856 [Ditylenchus destructor]
MENENSSVTNEQTINIDDDIVPQSQSSTKPTVHTELVGCRNCKAFCQNAEQAWSMCADYGEKLGIIRELQTENQQLHSINNERQTYLANQQQKFQHMKNELDRKDSTVAEMHDKHKGLQEQYTRVLSVATEAQGAANSWRQKYEESQKLIMQLETKVKETHSLNISSMSVAAAFSNKYEKELSRNKEIEEQCTTLQRLNEQLLSRIAVLEGNRIITENKVAETSIDKEKVPSDPKMLEDASVRSPPPSPPRPSISEMNEVNNHHLVQKEIKHETLKAQEQAPETDETCSLVRVSKETKLIENERQRPLIIAAERKTKEPTRRKQPMVAAEKQTKEPTRRKQPIVAAEKQTKEPTRRKQPIVAAEKQTKEPTRRKQPAVAAERKKRTSPKKNVSIPDLQSCYVISIDEIMNCSFFAEMRQSPLLAPLSEKLASHFVEPSNVIRMDQTLQQPPKRLNEDIEAIPSTSKVNDESQTGKRQLRQTRKRVATCLAKKSSKLMEMKDLAEHNQGPLRKITAPTRPSAPKRKSTNITSSPSIEKVPLSADFEAASIPPAPSAKMSDDIETSIKKSPPPAEIQASPSKAIEIEPKNRKKSKYAADIGLEESDDSSESEAHLVIADESDLDEGSSPKKDTISDVSVK